MAASPLNTIVAGAVLSFLDAPSRKNGNLKATHTFMTKGRFQVLDDDMCQLHQLIAGAIDHEGPMPCVTEQRTEVFPAYMDLDLKVLVQTLDHATLVEMARIATSQLMRFYESADRPPHFQCIVCTKSGAAAADDAGLVKHGVHLHWPNVHVDEERMLQIRWSAIAGLDRVDWLDGLGTSRVDWDDAVDVSVYSNGLRMIGAPKAKPCGACKGRKEVTSCPTCARMNNCHVVDGRVYGLATVLSGVEEDGGALDAYRANTTRLVRATSVRCKAGQEPTEGYAVYRGCPPAPAVAARGGRKGKRPLQDDSHRIEPRYRKQDAVTDPRVVGVLRALLLRHSAEYEATRLTVRFDGVGYKVLLQGDNATYCLNKRDVHNSNRVYMVVQPDRDGRSYSSRMKCFCTCRVIRQPNQKMCANYSSTPVALERDDAYVLFAKTATAPGAPPPGVHGRNLAKSLGLPTVTGPEYMEKLRRELEELDARCGGQLE